MVSYKNALEAKMDLASAFKYLRADGQWVELGPFSQDEANEKRSRMAGFGATCSGIYPVEVSAEEFVQLKREKESYVAGRVAQFKTYLSAELAVLDTVHNYNIIYSYIKPLSGRVKMFLQQETPGNGMTKGTYSKEVEAKFALYRVEYLAAVSEELARRSNGYGPMDGSVPEDIGKLLEGLSKKVLRSISQ